MRRQNYSIYYYEFMKLNKKVLVGISGGVDSAVAAALLLERGYDVVGITITPIKISDDCFADTRESGCCNYQAIIDARDVAEQLGIEHHLVDLSEIFKEKIINNFIDEYLNGRTPNPCALCNPIIKWGEVLKHASKYSCDFYATGHYAKIVYNEIGMRYAIEKGDDPKKDQSYFLWGLTQEHLAKTIFPLADIDKSITRDLARKYNIPVHNKAESQEICFVPSNDYKEFLVDNVQGIDKKYAGGDIVFDDEKIGIHKGFPFYTVGQRKGLGISHNKPLYVKAIIPEKNTVIVAEEEELLTSNLVAENVNMMKYSDFPEGKIFTAKIRYRDVGAACKCEVNDKGELIVKFDEPRKAITPGQSVVIYEDAQIVAGAIIREAF